MRLKYLPQPHLLWFNNELRTNPKARSTLANMIWVCCFILIILIHVLLLQRENASGPFLTESKSSQLHLHASVAVVIAIMCLESYRLFFFTKILARYVHLHPSTSLSNFDRCATVLIRIQLFSVGNSSRQSTFALRLLDRLKELLLSVREST